MKKLNSQEMKTIVETFLVEETIDLIYDNDKLEKWNELVTKLGLSGQSKIVKKERSPMPFLHMKKGLVNVFQELCPVQVKIEDYSLSAIPLEILDLIALSRREGYFDKIQIWYDDQKPDPVCVGTKGVYVPKNNGNYLWDEKTENYEEAAAKCSVNSEPYETETTYYLIGKWADVKQSFEELKERAIKRFKESRYIDIEHKIKELNREKDDLEHTCLVRFS